MPISPNPGTAFYLEMAAAIIILIGTVVNIYLHNHGHRHNIKDIDVILTDRSPGSDHWEAKRSLSKLWNVLLDHVNLHIEINPEPKEDLLIQDTSKPTDVVLHKILETIKTLPDSKIKELIEDVQKLPPKEETGISGMSNSSGFKMT